MERIHGDREKDEEFRGFLNSRTWDVVVDFTSFDAGDIAQITDCLLGKVNHYIFISSDSTYEVCPANTQLDFETITAQDTARREAPIKTSFWDLIHPPGQTSPRSEDSAIRPQCIKLQKLLKKKDSYADGKLRCEELLCEAWTEHQFPWTAVRLPDVIGPYDHTKRHWRYQLSTQSDACPDPIQVDRHGPNRKLGLVFSEDVVTAIQRIIQTGKTCFGEPFNLCCTETPTLIEYATLVGQILGFNNLNFNVLPGKSPRDFSFPSVSFGPISNQKARLALSWEPTSLEIAVKSTVVWFQRAFLKYPQKIPFNHLSEESIARLKEKYAKASLKESQPG